MGSLAAVEQQVDHLLDRAKQLHSLFTGAGIPYRIIGGLAIFVHVDEIDPESARVTRDIDAAMDRKDLPALIQAATEFGWEYRHVAGMDMLLDPARRNARSAVHLVFLNEFLRPDYPQPIPASAPILSSDHFYIASVADLVLMKLTSFRLKDKVHIQDLDAVGLITPEIEASLPPELQNRLAEVRATE